MPKDRLVAFAKIFRSSQIPTPAKFAPSDIHCETVMIPMRDGVRLATDLYSPPALPAHAVAMRTPYGRARDLVVGASIAFARRGYVVIAQDCRGTGASEPEEWDYYVREPEDSYDLAEWVRKQTWFGGFLGGIGASYSAQTQWQMAMHPATSAIAPYVSGLGIATNTLRLHMFAEAYSQTVGKGRGSSDRSWQEVERSTHRGTLQTGYFNEPLHAPLPPRLSARFPHLLALRPTDAQLWLWEHYCSLGCAARADFVKAARDTANVTLLDVEWLGTVFGQRISHDAHTLPHPRPAELFSTFRAPVLLRTGWYDWGLNDALATWQLLTRTAPEGVRSQSRLIIGPSAHNMPGYHEGIADRPELQHSFGVSTTVELLLRWFDAVKRHDLDQWPEVIYYLLGANEWRSSGSWPPPETYELSLYLGSEGTLGSNEPSGASWPDEYVYDPDDPTPTVGGSIVSDVYLPGSVDVARVQERPDVLVYTTAALERDLDVVGPLRLVLYASSSAVDTDFVARLTDVFPDGRAIQLQNGALRARYRDISAPALLEPGRIYQFEIDMWAVANRFGRGHRLRVDISSADFPRYDRNSNRGGDPGPAINAVQRIYHDPAHPSRLLIRVLGEGPLDAHA